MGKGIELALPWYPHATHPLQPTSAVPRPRRKASLPLESQGGNAAGRPRRARDCRGLQGPSARGKFRPECP